MKLSTMLNKLSATFLIVFLAAGCAIQQPATVKGLDEVVGDALPGAKGYDLESQNRIDITINRGCATGLWTKAQCQAHFEVSLKQREVLSEQMLIN